MPSAIELIGLASTVRSAMRLTRPVPGRFSQSPREPVLEIETALESREWERLDGIDWVDIHRATDGDDTTCTLQVGALDAGELTGAGSIGDAHLAYWIEQLTPDRRVRVMMPGGLIEASVLFQGYVVSKSVVWDPRRQAVSVTCLDEGIEVLRTAPGAQITGRMMRRDPSADWQPYAPDLRTVETLPLTFNAEGRPNRADWPIAMDDGTGSGGVYTLQVFSADDAPDAVRWQYADALRYLAYFHIRAQGLPVSVVDFLADTDELVSEPPAPHDSDPFRRRMLSEVTDTPIVSGSVFDAIAALCDRADLRFEVATRAAMDGTSSYVDAEHYLRVWAPVSTSDEESATPDRLMGSPAVHDIAREAPYTDQSGRTPRAIAEANRAVAAHLTVDHRGINAPIVLGGLEMYEVTLLLRPGWMPNEYLDGAETTAEQEELIQWWQGQFNPEYHYDEPDVPRCVFHREHPDFASVADVFRLWVFPDTGDYVGYARESGFTEALYSPYMLADSHQPLVWADSRIGGGIPTHIVDDWVLRRRPFGETVGRENASTADRRPIVRLHYNAPDPWAALAQDGWRTYTADPVFDEERAAIWLGETNPFNSVPMLRDPHDAFGDNALIAYIEGRLQVSITCTVLGDRRLSRVGYATGAFGRTRSQVVDLGRDKYQARYRRTSHDGDYPTNSHLNALPEDGPLYEDRDDGLALSRFAQAHADASAPDTIAGDPECWWIDTSYRPGDAISGASGLGIMLDRYTPIHSVTYRKSPQGGYRTVLHMADLRGSPEIGAEVSA